jgi:hypothetical protein
MSSATIGSAALDHKKPHKQESSSKGQNSDPPPINALEQSYLMIFQAVEIGRSTAEIQNKGMEANAIQQNHLIALEAQQHLKTFGQELFFSLHKNVVNADGGPSGDVWVLKEGADLVKAQKTFETAQIENQRTTAIRQSLENQIGNLKQSASIKETNVNTCINDCEQSIQQCGSIMTMAFSLAQQIARV